MTDHTDTHSLYVLIVSLPWNRDRVASGLVFSPKPPTLLLVSSPNDLFDYATTVLAAINIDSSA